ncbi:inositol 2-dehydrogenase [Arthrospiribacter ruber]|uniref:Inositol 2-dehydrogenase n=1 Tax=Arthrospiribacter ruber TaxID=2487934 RepID=A0A951J0X1_9BACT|nr:inositol 2-dehydrogenase [Arthrospiribacter ruber]MBW3469522.1 inositol 2-dehydrogenase [Arthrospiribacter ruber]
MEKTRVGIIGMGRIGKIHYANIKNQIENADVVAISDPYFDSDLGIPNVDAHEVFNNKKVDAVIICSPTDTHADYISASAQAGKHIFCEKPHDLSIHRVIETLDEVHEAGVKLMLGFNRRFDPNFQKIKSLIGMGEIGDVHLLKITSRDPSPPSLEYLKSSGGMFLDMTIHDFDMARFIMGKEVKEVFAVAGAFVSKDVEIAGDFDTAVVTLKFNDGTMAVIDNSRKAVYGYDQRLEIFGSNGMAKVDNNKPDTHVLYNQHGAHGSLPLNFFMDRYTMSYQMEMEMFIKAINTNSEMPVTGTDGLKALLIALAAQKSVEENRPVQIEEIGKNASIIL